MKNAILIFSLLVLSGCAENMFAQPVAEVLSKTTDGKILLEKWPKLKERAILEAGAAMDFGSPRKIRKGKNPEIVVRRDEIYLNGKRLRFGDSLENWKKVIRGNPRCFDGGMILCLWDDLGIEVGTKHGSEKEVISMNLIFNLPEEDKDLGKTEYPDGTPAEKFPEYATRDVFPGFLELDGFGIDSVTEFWEIRTSVDQSRLLDCGLRDCTFPSGAFGNNGHIYLKLNGVGPKSTLQRFGLSISEYN